MEKIIIQDYDSKKELRNTVIATGCVDVTIKAIRKQYFLSDNLKKT